MAQEISSFNDLIQWFLVVDAATGKLTGSLHLWNKLGILKSMSVVRKVFPGSYHLCNLYEMKFKSVTVITVLDEAKVLESIYTNSEVYNRIGKEMCIVIDIALAKGGTEAIVESFYSSTASQAMHGGQSSEVLALRLVDLKVLGINIYNGKNVYENVVIYETQNMFINL